MDPDDNDEDLSAYMNDKDGNFVTNNEREEQAARQRREARKKRLQLAASTDAQKTNHVAAAAAAAAVSAPLKALREQADDNEKDAVGRRKRMRVDDETDDEHDDDGAAPEDDSDGFDMFSNSVSPVIATTEASRNVGNNDAAIGVGPSRGHGQEDYDDADGYYKAVIGETIQVEQRAIKDSAGVLALPSGGALLFRVAGIVGKGVFSTVLQASTTHNTSSVVVPPVVALKFIRHNETMAKAALQEIQVLQRLKDAPGIVQLRLPTAQAAAPIEHRGHVILVFDYMEYNLRDVLSKFGKGVGLSLQAVRSYFGQLLAAATHLKKHHIIHADLKPDNVLVNSDYSIVQISDLGSAIDLHAPESNQAPTPYLVSRFYRAPEIILGLPPTFAIDLWSLAVTVAELYLGDVLFNGGSNNDMLYVFMQCLGPFSNRIIRQHLVQASKLPNVPAQFSSGGATYSFTRHTTDPVTGQPVVRHVTLSQQTTITASAPNHSSGSTASSSLTVTPLKSRLLMAKSANDARQLVLFFADLLTKCLALDPTRRLAIKDALQHDFFRHKQQQQAVAAT